MVSLGIVSVNLPACVNTILYLFELVVVVIEPRTVVPKDNSVVGVSGGCVVLIWY